MACRGVHARLDAAGQPDSPQCLAAPFLASPATGHSAGHHLVWFGDAGDLLPCQGGGLRSRNRRRTILFVTGNLASYPLSLVLGGEGRGEGRNDGKRQLRNALEYEGEGVVLRRPFTCGRNWLSSQPCRRS